MVSKIKNLIRKRVIERPSDVKKLIALVDKYGLKVLKVGIGGTYKSMNDLSLQVKNITLSKYIIVQLKDTKLEITTKYFTDLKPCTYIFNLNGETIFSNNGQKCFTEFSKHYKVVKAKDNYHFLDRWLDEETGKYVCSARPIIGYNEKYNAQELTNCYEYDLNSAYSSILMHKIPDLKSIRVGRDIEVNDDEVGFLLDDELTMVESGYANVVFKLIDSPQSVKDFCEKYYTIKQTTTGVPHEEAKAMLNLPIGYCQRYNPFLRAYVVHSCNKLIKSKLDDDSLFWNTDAIFSKTRRTDLEIGDNIGQWKEIKAKKLKYKENSYQINDDIPKYRGIPKQWFKAFSEKNGRPFNILTDKLPAKCNLYSWNWDTLMLEANKYE